MAPKAGRRGRKRKAEAEEQRTPAEKKKERGEEEGKRVVIEHWDNAEEVKSALLAACPALPVILNPEKPRKKSFEITLMDGDKAQRSGDVTSGSKMTRSDKGDVLSPSSDESSANC
ncbi:hypothetical protein ACER0C_024300 [Sarotherodon galilaeus]